VRLSPFAASGWTSILIGRFSERGIPETECLVMSAATRLTAFRALRLTACAN
jgi:hypothetical protein